MTNSSWHILGFVDAKYTPLTSKGIGTVYSRAKDEWPGPEKTELSHASFQVLMWKEFHDVLW